MKMTIQKSFEFTIDTGKERQRIKDCWKSTDPTYKKLMHLMDLIEAEKWQAAEKELDSKWWQGRDSKQECPRLEFVGLLDAEGSFTDPWDSYANLIWRMNRNPDVYKVTNKA